MNIFTTLILGIFMGIIFGFTLEKSRVFEPGIIISQFQLRKFIMLKVFLTAIITGCIIFSGFFALGFERLTWKVTIYAADIIGGALLGIGIALAGACPGTLFAQIGAGYKDSIATLLGGLLGAITFIKLQPWLKTTILNGAPQQKLTLDGVLGLNLTTTTIIVVTLLLLILFLLERRQSWRQELGKSLDGL